MQASGTNEDSQRRMFRASRFWETNVAGAVVAGLGGAVFFLVIAGILVIGAPGRETFLWGAIFVLTVVAGLLLLFPGNWAAGFPYAVEVEEGKGLRLHSLLKKLYIPIEELEEVRWSWLELGWSVRLNTRHGVLKSFLIHAGFGAEAKELVQAIKAEIANRPRARP